MDKLKGILFVAFGAASYGLLATMVKVANLQGLSTAMLTFYQYLLGFLVLSLAAYHVVRKKPPAFQRGDKRSLILFGSSLGFTSSLYYLSIQYVPVSVAIILLMQTIWMGVVVELLISRQKPQALKIIGALVVLIGTFLAVDAFDNLDQLNLTGVFYGVAAAVSFTVTLTATNRIATHLPNIIRSQYMVLGGVLAVLLFWNFNLISSEIFNPKTFTFGLFLALFGTLIPPIMFNKGFPIIGIGLGTILTAIEIPVSMLSANWLLQEELNAIQWLGVAIIIIAVVIINYRHLNAKEV
ncbi:EamA family transporter [Marinicella gelatinilytica]|uniref:EamA family transporter n=1 Tax=Marinicella gelatinilytica TaxID=2996017 RepID=UPI0022609D5A|nr:EamA family transporter [Marinicella gelatinilytica]MCX7543839.1 EamA family transporter [Marinicella gelatinilytica]